MTLDRYGATLERTISPRRVYRYTRPQRPCDALKQRLDQGAVDDSDYLSVFYHQYWAGQRVMLQWLLPRSRRRRVAAPAAGADVGPSGRRARRGVGHRDRNRRPASGLGTHGARQPEATARSPASLPGTKADPLVRRQTQFQAVALAALFGSLLLFLDLDDRAGSFTTGASNVLTVFLLLAVPRRRAAHWRPSLQVVLFAAFGALIAYHELLFGSALIGLAGLLLALAVAPPPANDHGAEPSDRPRDPRTWRRRLLIRCAGAYASCLTAVFLLRVVIAELVFREPVLFKFWDQLTFRLYGAPRSSIHPDIDPFYRQRADSRTNPRTDRKQPRHRRPRLANPGPRPDRRRRSHAGRRHPLRRPPLVDARRPLALGRHPRRRLVRPRLVRRLLRPHAGPRARDDPSAGAGLRRGRGARHRSGDVPSEDRRTLKSRSLRPEISELTPNLQADTEAKSLYWVRRPSGRHPPKAAPPSGPRAVRESAHTLKSRSPPPVVFGVPIAPKHEYTPRHPSTQLDTGHVSANGRHPRIGPAREGMQQTQASTDVPRVGMLARVRNRRGIVAGVAPYDGEAGRLHPGAGRLQGPRLAP